MDTLDITEVARRTGLTVQALRFYEARGLVAPLRAASGRRFYGAGELARLNAVVALKRAGFSLAEIARLLRERRPDLSRLVAARLADVEHRAEALAATRTLLLTVQSRLDRGEPIDVATLCSLIDGGSEMTEQENWRDISARYLSDEAKADFAAARAALPADFDQAAMPPSGRTSAPASTRRCRSIPHRSGRARSRRNGATCSRRFSGWGRRPCGRARAGCMTTCRRGRASSARPSRSRRWRSSSRWRTEHPCHAGPVPA